MAHTIIKDSRRLNVIIIIIHSFDDHLAALWNLIAKYDDNVEETLQTSNIF